MEKFNLEIQYQKYLERVGLKESQMGDTQRVETKRAFMGGCGQMLVILSNDISQLDEDKGIEQLQDMIDQVKAFWKEQNK